MKSDYHRSVLLNSTIDILDVNPDGTYVDLTFGGGGHSRELLSRLSKKGTLYGFDQDPSALVNKIDDPRVHLIFQNFDSARDYLIAIGVTEIDGVLADLGVSSFQLDDDDSGFSYRSGVALDMRMNSESNQPTAKDILNTYTDSQLQDIFQNYGEVRNAKSLAKAIVAQRQVKPFEISDDLNLILDKMKFGTFESYAAPIYQALRMEVNGEIRALEAMLTSISDIIKPEGVLAVISFHSLEDRIVKNFMKYGNPQGAPPADLYGRRPEWNWEILTKKPITATETELKQNPRSRSAKLRAMKRKK